MRALVLALIAILLFALIPAGVSVIAPARAATVSPTFVGSSMDTSKFATQSTQFSVSYAAVGAANSLLIIHTFAYAATTAQWTTITSLTDNAASTPIFLRRETASATTTDGEQEIWYLKSPTPGSHSFTATYDVINPNTGQPTNTVQGGMAVSEYANVDLTKFASSGYYWASRAISVFTEQPNVQVAQTTSTSDAVVDFYFTFESAAVSSNGTQSREYNTITSVPNLGNWGQAASSILYPGTLGPIDMGWTQPVHGVLNTVYRWILFAITLPGTTTPSGGGSPPSPGGGGGGGQFVPGFNAECALGSFDWLLRTTQPGSKTVTLDDTRPEAALAILYLVNWGDGEWSQATSTPINHTYEEGKLYNVTVRVQYRNNVIEYFVTYMDVRGNNCSLQKFSREITPILWALGALSVVSAAIVTGARYRIAPDRRRALRRIFLTVGIVTLASVMTIVVYAYFAGIPI